RCGVMFFFSSRRRHTRWPRDWSSDVCSSDLERGKLVGGLAIEMGKEVQLLDHRQLRLQPVQMPQPADQLAAFLRLVAFALGVFEIGRASCRESVYMPARAGLGKDATKAEFSG